MLIHSIEAFLKKHDMAATKFGRDAAGDPRFVLDLRMGRSPRPRTEARIRGWMAEYEVTARKARRTGRPIGEAFTPIPAPIAGIRYKDSIEELNHV